jgi:hypothetical protein
LRHMITMADMITMAGMHRVHRHVSSPIIGSPCETCQCSADPSAIRFATQVDAGTAHTQKALPSGSAKTT